MSDLILGADTSSASDENSSVVARPVGGKSQRSRSAQLCGNEHETWTCGLTSPRQLSTQHINESPNIFQTQYLLARKGHQVSLAHLTDRNRARARDSRLSTLRS